MPKTTAPLLSFDARGQIAKTQVYSSWRGVSYVRRYVIPANPQTDAQMKTRNIFSMLNQAWLFAPAAVRAPWDAFATGKPLTGRNKFIGDNVKALGRSLTPTTMADFIFSPGALGGLPPTSLALTPSGTSISASVVLPDSPVGWTLTSSVAAAIPNSDPTAAFGGVWAVNEETDNPDTNVVTGLTASTAYDVGIWLTWTRPDGKIAYSVALSDIASTT